MRWKSFTRKSKPTKSLKQLRKEVDNLKKANKKVKSYQELLKEKEKIKSEIKREGFKVKHRNALAIINSGLNIGKKIGKGLKWSAKKARPHVHRHLKKRKSKLAKII